MEQELKELRQLLRETIMRAHLAIPQNDQDREWRDMGLDDGIEDFSERLFNAALLKRD